jgi:3-hydroxyacyl-[acyl-carrier-protein] dehydratase
VSDTPKSASTPDGDSPLLQFNIEEILNILPHRYPFLLIDRITAATENSVTGIKSVTMNEWFFQGHFPKKPVMPGVLILEAMAQTGAVMVHQWEENKGKLVFLAGVDEARFRRLVQPGDQLRLEVTQVYRRRGVGRSQCKAYVGEDLACEALLTFMAER